MGNACGSEGTEGHSRGTDRELAASVRDDKDFEFRGTFNAKVVSVYDGDTIRVKFRYNRELQQHKVRIARVDTPELIPRLAVPNRDAVIAEAKRARQVLIDWLPEDRLVTLVCTKRGKYGRILGEILVGTDSLNDMLIEQGWPYPT